MALFDFLKKKEKQEKHEARKQERRSSAPKAKEESVKENSALTEIVDSKNEFAKGVVTDSFVLVSPHVTERARMLAEAGQYTFRVHPRATKRQIRESVEKLYKVHVDHIQVTKVQEKKRRRGLTEGVKKGYKKAVVALRTGEAIDIF